jgi:hypothetical protein
MQDHVEEFKKYKASVFRGLSIVELSMFILLKQWKLLADHYVDYSGKMSKVGRALPPSLQQRALIGPLCTQDEIAKMLEQRAKKLEISHRDYMRWLSNPRDGAASFRCAWLTSTPRANACTEINGGSKMIKSDSVTKDTKL